MKIKRNIFLIITWSIFLIYLTLLFKVILFKYQHSQALILDQIRSQFHLEVIKNKIAYSSNFIPCRTIFNYIFNNDNWRIGYVNIVGNIILFIPFGLIISLMRYKSNTNRRVCLYAFILSLSLELVQLLFGFGQFDIDDLILNSVGAIIGLMIFHISTSIFMSRFRKWFREDLNIR
jgi:glycopeptide antibiotics resistance protein